MRLCLSVVCTVVALAVGDSETAAAQEPLLRTLELHPLTGDPNWLTIGCQELNAKARLLIGCHAGWPKWTSPRPAVPDRPGRWLVPAGECRAGAWRAVAVPPDLTAKTSLRWPAGVDLVAEVDSVGPGGQGVWIRAGENQGVQVGDAWWERQGGQPTSRYDVRYVSADLSYCERVALSADARPLPGTQVALWPAPRDRAAGIARSAVCFVDGRGGGVEVWIAAPPHADAPIDAHVEFTRAGRYVGYGRVERRDSRFWYVRFAQPAADRPPSPTTAGSAEGAADGPGRAAGAGGAAMPRPPTATGPHDYGRDSGETLAWPRVGDEARVRTNRDIAARRFVARVFALSERGPLMDAGETEQVQAGAEVVVWRGGREIGRAVVRASQRTYSSLELVTERQPPAAGGTARGLRPFDPQERGRPGPGAAVPGLMPGDEIRWQPPPGPPDVVGEIEQVLDADLFVARLRPGEVPGFPLAIVDADQSVRGVALLAGPVFPSVGFVIPASSRPLLQRGMRLVRSE